MGAESIRSIGKEYSRQREQPGRAPCSEVGSRKGLRQHSWSRRREERFRDKPKMPVCLCWGEVKVKVQEGGWAEPGRLCYRLGFALWAEKPQEGSEQRTKDSSMETLCTIFPTPL